MMIFLPRTSNLPSLMSPNLILPSEAAVEIELYEEALMKSKLMPSGTGSMLLTRSAMHIDSGIVLTTSMESQSCVCNWSQQLCLHSFKPSQHLQFPFQFRGMQNNKALLSLGNKTKSLLALENKDLTGVEIRDLRLHDGPLNLCAEQGL